MLALPIKKKWFDMILSGFKTEEYREIKPYWTKRLQTAGLLDKRHADEATNRKVWVLFRNGYGKNARSFEAQVDLLFCPGIPEWGGDNNNTYYTLRIHKIKEHQEEKRREHMTEKEYNEAEGVRRSDLWRMNDSPEKYKFFLDNPQESTPALTFGAACHKFVLENEEFFNEYAVALKVDRRTKEGKEIWERFCQENEGKTIISADDYDVMDDMMKKIMSCSLAKSLLYEDGETEVPFFWTDADTGEKCKVKLDRLINGEDGRKYVVDYKTAACADTNRFNNEIWKLGYYLQAAMYTEGVMQCLKLDYRPTFLFVAQEKKPPYAVNVIEVSEEVMNAGVAKFHELLERLHNCKEVDIYPGYVDDVPNETFLPGWVSLEGDDE